MTAEREPRYAIGQQFMSVGKNARVMTVIDIHKTYNAAGEMVKLRYVTEHEFCGQMVKTYDVVETTIARSVG